MKKFTIIVARIRHKFKNDADWWFNGVISQSKLLHVLFAVVYISCHYVYTENTHSSYVCNRYVFAEQQL